MFYPGRMDQEVTKGEIRRRRIARRAAAEGMVLLENDGMLPLKPGQRVALYGGGALYPVKGGTGSGAVNCRPCESIASAMEKAGFVITNREWLKDYQNRYESARQEWILHVHGLAGDDRDPNALYAAHAANPMVMPKGAPILAEQISGEDRENAAALFVISRVSGEGADRKNREGDFLLSREEEETLSAITGIYCHTAVILNIGGIMDLSFLDRHPAGAVVLMSLGGMEGAGALTDVLSGRVPFSGKLTDSWAYCYEDYPCSIYRDFDLPGRTAYEEGIYVGYRYFDSFGKKVRYPFGYGLSYTEFSVIPGKITMDASAGTVSLTVTVTNTGSRPGRETVQVYVSCPEGKRKKEAKRLAAFQKTPELSPGQSCRMMLSFDAASLASYHTGRSCWYLDAGEYFVLCGTDVLHAEPAGCLLLSEEAALSREEPICPLQDALSEITPGEIPEKLREQYRRALSEKGINPLSMDSLVRNDAEKGKTEPKRSPEHDKARSILKSMPREDRIRLVCGSIKGGKSEDIGNASVTIPGAAGEISHVTASYGIEPPVMADGPAGLRLQQCYESDEKSGRILALSPYETMENRFFGMLPEHDHAVKHYQFCTAFPIGTLLAQSFDPDLVEEVGLAIGEEMEESHVRILLAPGMNIQRDPLCGRNYEYYSEDPLLTGTMAAAMVRGIQEKPGRGAVIKHFACNNEEHDRRSVSAVVSERALREIYLKGFEIAVKTAHPAAIMTSYNKVNGVHAAVSRDLCTIAARKEWGFDGFIMTDWTITNAKGGAHAAKCIDAGCDLVMPGRESDLREIRDALDEMGDYSLSEDRLDDACLRILSFCLAAGS